MSDRARRRAALAGTLLGAGVSVAVPLVTVPRLPAFSLPPLVAGLVVWTLGKYLLCPLRWHALSDSGRPRRWHLAAYAESELVGLLTPGHVGADAWRMHRLRRAGMPALGAVADVAVDRLVGAAGLAAFTGLAATAVPVRLLAAALGAAVAGGVAALLVRRHRPHWLPRRRWPAPGRLAQGLALSLAYQASIVVLLLGTLVATGHGPAPADVVAAVGASQLAGVVPGPHGASPRDGALVAALVALGVPWTAALGAVSLKALLAWAPAILLGGGCLLAARVRRRTP